MNAQNVFEIIKRDAVSIYSEEGLMEKLKSNKKLKIKLGADPSRPDLHLGHSVVLRKLRLLQDIGHEIIFVIGDFTGMIGDPSGKSKTRVPLTFEQTRMNGQTYFNQVTKILDKEKTKIVYNSEWLSKMNFEEVLKLAGKYTVARILERADFSKRYNENQAIGLHEMFYPLMQGYDSVALNADIEVGGTDQTFNLLVGRELQRDYNQLPQEVITFPLLVGLDGIEKMSKSLDNYIGIDESPEIMFEKCMKVPDSIIEDYFRLTTDIPENIYKKLIDKDVREAHFIYAEEIVTIYHSASSAELAKKRYYEIAAKSIPDDIDIYEINKDDVNGNEIRIVELIKMVGFSNSIGEARRHILGKGIKIGGDIVQDVDLIINFGDNFVLQFGKNRFVKVIFK